MTTTRRLSLAYLALTAGVAVLFALNLFWGSVSLTPGAVAAALLGRGEDALAVGIVLQLRLPRAVMVVLLGAALSAAGYLLQTFFANPIAGPFVMGVSSGAKLAVALTMVVFLQQGLLTGSATLIIAAFAGSMAAMAFVLVVARRVPRMSILVICGIMIGYICSAVTDIVVTFAQDSNIVNLHNWSMGSFSGMTWANVGAAACVVLPALAAAFLLSKPMAAYQMGESYARSVGVPVRAFSTALVLLSSLLSACVTAFAGPISFVGIAVPHLVKNLLGSAKPLYVLPGCCLGGAAFCLLCIARGADPRFVERSEIILRVPVAMLCGALCPIERVRVVLRNALPLQIEPADLTLGQRIALFGQFQMPLEAGFIFSGFPVSVDQLAAAVVFRAGLIIIDFHRYLLVFISPTCR